MHRKGAQDAKRAKVFAKLAREIFVAAKSGLPDPAFNPRLRSALATAREANMPKDNIDRAIKKATGSGESCNYEEVRYEGYGPGGIAFIVETLSDNRNRTASEIRSIFSKHGGNLGESGSVAFLFSHIGFFYIKKPYDYDTLFEKALQAGAESVEEDDEGYEVCCAVEDFSHVRDVLSDIPECCVAERIFKPFEEASCDKEQIQKIIDLFEENEDVQHVYTNAQLGL